MQTHNDVFQSMRRAVEPKCCFCAASLLFHCHVLSTSPIYCSKEKCWPTPASHTTQERSTKLVWDGTRMLAHPHAHCMYFCILLYSWLSSLPPLMGKTRATKKVKWNCARISFELTGNGAVLWHMSRGILGLPRSRLHQIMVSST